MRGDCDYNCDCHCEWLLGFMKEYEGSVGGLNSADWALRWGSREKKSRVVEKPSVRRSSN